MVTWIFSLTLLLTNKGAVPTLYLMRLMTKVCVVSLRCFCIDALMSGPMSYVRLDEQWGLSDASESTRRGCCTFPVTIPYRCPCESRADYVRRLPLYRVLTTSTS